jgi:hypothetical protein
VQNIYRRNFPGITYSDILRNLFLFRDSNESEFSRECRCRDYVRKNTAGNREYYVQICHATYRKSWIVLYLLTQTLHSSRFGSSLSPFRPTRKLFCNGSWKQAVTNRSVTSVHNLLKLNSMFMWQVLLTRLQESVTCWLSRDLSPFI